MRFCWGFWVNLGLVVVFLWTKSGELCGKRGKRNALKTTADFLHGFQVYFGRREMGSEAAIEAAAFGFSSERDYKPLSRAALLSKVRTEMQPAQMPREPMRASANEP